MGQPFVDYYEALQVHVNADQETIERVYRLLAKRYHPDRGGGADGAAFDVLTKAYRTLSDPVKRAEYDARYQAAKACQARILARPAATQTAEEDRRIYQGILSILYLARRRDASKPGVGIVALEKMVGLSEKEMEFHIWYLKEKGWIQRLDTGGFAITVKGVEAVMEHDLLLKNDHFLPEAARPGDASEPSPTAEPPAEELP
jgi:curved DNA-binding protein